MADGYATDGASLDLGAVVLDGRAFPTDHIRVPLAMMNRHGLIAGATGTGKTRTLQLFAERLSAHGVPVVVADLKGDLSGLATPGAANDRVTTRAADTGDDWTPTAFPVEFLALGGLGNGVPVRATVTSFGPILLSKVLGLNATQESSLNLMFHWADKAKLPLVDLKDLQSVVRYLVSDDGKADLESLGGISKATAGVIGRQLVTLADGGGDVFFGEPEWSPADLMRTATDGRGVISSLELSAIQDKPVLFSTFLMWLLADLFEELPEIGDVDKPGLVFFFDEAHLLFDSASKAFLDAVAQTVRLIRSKGVGIFFVTQHPTDVPDEVLAQLGNRVQHALRAFTPDDATALKKTVRTYPTTENYDLANLLTQLGTGEAVVTVLSERGAPTPVAWTRLAPPRADMGQLPEAQQTAAVQGSPLIAKYGQAVDRESAYELLAAKLAPPPPAPTAQPAGPTPSPKAEAPRSRPRTEQEHDDGAMGTIGKVLGSKAFQSMARSVGTQLGREITRGVFGTRRR
ncbi:helicase HerA-like domain-containing protein [Jatrophihabitans sp. YIM 134969]